MEHRELWGDGPVCRRSLCPIRHETRKGKHLKMSRGIIYVVVQINPEEQIRVMQVHLKSRRIYPELDNRDTGESGDVYVRRNEAVILKNAMNRILEKNPSTKLLLMGDC